MGLTRLALALAVLTSLDSSWSDGAVFGARRDDPARCPCAGSPGDCAALADLYTATRGAGWANATGWCDGGSPCAGWHGVSADAHPECPQWAQEGACQAEEWAAWMEANCPASCGVATSCAVLSLNLHSNGLKGSVPSTITGLAELSGLLLYRNSLSGTMPVDLASLTQLARLYLGYNRLSGTMPVELASLTQLSEFGLANSRLSGTLPVELASLTRLTNLILSQNDLSGSVPAELASPTKLAMLFLSGNSLSGSVPVELANLAELTELYLSSNDLSGSVPVELASLTKLSRFQLGYNRLSGTVPVELASLTKLSQLDLYNNRLSGTVPVELASLAELTAFDLYTNRLSGTVPVELASLAELTVLNLYNNRLSGTVPMQLANLTQLTRLVLGKNRLSGTLSHGLPLSLQALMLHSNYLSGSLPSFTNHSSLVALTLFDNNVGGRLRLPRHSRSLQVLAVHRNRLSCPVEYNSSSYNLSVQLSVLNNYTTGALIAPGNRLSATAKPSWALMSLVPFLWDPEDFWQEWRIEICVAVAGLLGGAVVVGAVLKAEWRSFFRFRPRGLYERYSYLCLRLLLGLGVCGLVLIPVYLSGSGEFECGRPWLGATLAYLSGSPLLEQAAAVLSCLMLALQAFVAVAVRFWSPPDVTMEDTGVRTSLSWQRWLAVVLLWPVTTLVLSLPAFLAVLADSVPGGENTLGLSKTMLDGFGFATAPLLTLIESVLVPAVARGLVGKGAPRTLVGLIALAQFTILLVVPFVTALAFGSDCYGLWISVWEPCSSGDSFNMAYSVPKYMVVVHGVRSYYGKPIPVTTHNEVCDSQPPAYGRCPRYVIESLAKLLTSKMVFNAFVSPVLSVLLCLPWVVKVRTWLMKTLLRRTEYTYCLHLDVELAQMLSLLAGSIVLGIAVPEFTVLSILAVAGRLAAVHLMTSKLGVQFKEDHKKLPSWWYLLAAVPLGSGLVLWFFMSNAARVHGEMIVCIGAPLAILLGLGAGWAVGYDLYGDKDADPTDAPTVVKFTTLPSRAVIEFESRELS